MNHPTRLRRAVGAVLVTVCGLSLTGCLPSEIDAVRTVFGHRQSIHLDPFLVCVRHGESDRTVYPYDRGYGAQNPHSTASGAYQFLDSTWRSASSSAGYWSPAWQRAKYAPVWVQDEVAYWLSRHGGRSAWSLDHC